MSTGEEKESILLLGLLIAFLDAALSASSFPFMLQYPGVHMNIISLFDFEKRFLIFRGDDLKYFYIKV